MSNKPLFCNSRFLPLLCLVSCSAFAATGDSSFTPTKVIIPINGIALEDASGNSSVIYSCDGGVEACGINIADPKALATLSDNAAIDVGTYDRISVGTCRFEDGYDAIISGKMTIEGTDYYTTTPEEAGVSDILTTDVDQLGDVTLHYDGCSSDYMLQSPITVAEGDSILVNLFVNLENITWARTAESESIPSGCVTNSGGGNNQVVCMAYPDVVAYIGESKPKVQTYLVSIDGSNNETDGQLILLFKDDGSPIGGFTRPFYSVTSSGYSGFDTPLNTFKQNDDGVSYSIGNYGDSATTYARYITDFIPAESTGDIVTGKHNEKSIESAGVGYKATLQ